MFEAQVIQLQGFQCPLPFTHPEAAFLSLQVLGILRQYLSEYVENIPDEALKISVWQGDSSSNHVRTEHIRQEGCWRPVRACSHVY